MSVAWGFSWGQAWGAAWGVDGESPEQPSSFSEGSVSSAWGLAWDQAWNGAWGVVDGESPAPPAPAPEPGPPTPSGGYPSDRGPTKEQTRRSRAVFGIIEEVAQRQVTDLHLDDIQRRQELEGELRLRGIEFEIAYYEELNRKRQALIDSEIASRLRAIMEDDDVALAIILTASI